MLRSLRFFFSSSKFTISIIGRPNVGKSSLFNKLHAGKDSSIVSPEKGVTRDRKEVKYLFYRRVIVSYLRYQ